MIVILFKGPAKDLIIITSEWFKKQFADPSLTEQIPIHANFRIDWKKDILIKLGLPHSSKRENVYDSNNVWIDTRSINVIDLGTQDATTILKYELWRKNGESVSQSTTELVCLYLICAYGYVWSSSLTLIHRLMEEF